MHPNPNDFLYLGDAESKHSRERKPFGLAGSDRFRHLYAVGSTGMGKTEFLKSLIIQDIHAGRGVAVIDPHGDLAEDLLDFIPGEAGRGDGRTNDLVYFNPGDQEYPVGFNLMHGVAPNDRSRVAGSIVDVFHHVWADSWGPRLEQLLRNCVLALLEHEGETFLGILRMLQDEVYRNRIVKNVSNPTARAFWKQTFPEWGERYQAEAVAPVQNKIERLLSSDILRNILGQVAPKNRLGFVMDNRRIFIANLSKGMLSEGDSSLLGALLISAFSNEALNRARVEEGSRVPFHLFIDEFQNFGTRSFATILSEARKYRLGLTLAHQYLDQIPPQTMSAVLGNVGSIIAFRCGVSDSEILAEAIGSHHQAKDIAELPAYEVAARIIHGTEIETPYFPKTLAPLESLRQGRARQLVRHSRMKYGVPRHVIEEKIARSFASRGGTDAEAA